MRKLFGTDGIRGQANVYPMTGDVAFRLGQAIAKTFANSHKTKVIIGKDTRRSGYIFEYALTAGLCSMGANAYLIGPIPTPAVGHLVRSFAADVGIVISASHNPAGDNGIKLFDSRGYKLPDEAEEKIEKLVLSKEILPPPIENVGRAFRIDDAHGRYIEFAKGSISNTSLAGLRVVLDCAHGAAYKVAPLIMSELGAEVIQHGVSPDGLNINQGCGALYPEVLGKLVREHGADCGIALDGDADRLIMADEQGEVMDGDQVIAICALDLKEKGRLKNDTVVATVMSNMGLDKAMGSAGIRVVRTAVGDRYVIEEMAKNKYIVGGEQSGHIILAEHNTTGDGMLSALHVLRIMKEKGMPLSALRAFEPYPQVTVNVVVGEKKPLEKMPRVLALVSKVEKGLHGEGRVLVRYSGTEKKCRVMVEGRNRKKIEEDARQIAGEIKKETG